jgi:hypothetical protein
MRRRDFITLLGGANRSRSKPAGCDYRSDAWNSEQSESRKQASCTADCGSDADSRACACCGMGSLGRIRCFDGAGIAGLVIPIVGVAGAAWLKVW